MHLAANTIPWKALAEHGQNGPGQDKAARDWWKAELDSWKEAGPFEAEVDYAKTLSEEEEEKLFLSASSTWPDFVKRLLSRVFCYFETAFASIREHGYTPDKGRLEESELALSAAAAACIRCLPPALLHEFTRQLAASVSSRAIPHAWNGISCIVGSAVRADPKSGVDIFAPMLITAIRSEIEDKWDGAKHQDSCLSLEHDLVYFLMLLKQCLLNGGPETLRIKGDIMALFALMKNKCERHYTGRVGPTAILRAWTGTYPTSCDGTVRSGYWGWEDAEVSWHQPSPQELGAGCELFVSEMDEGIENLGAVIRQLEELDEQEAKDGKKKNGSLEKLERKQKLIRLLGDTLDYIDNLFVAAAALFDPVEQESSGARGRERAHHDGDAHHREQILTKMKDFRCVLHPEDPDYAKIHDCRRRSAAAVHGVLVFLRDHHEANERCHKRVYSIYYSVVSDVGYRSTPSVTDDYIRQEENMASCISLPMAEAPLLPGLHFLSMVRQHHRLQKYATRLRLSSEVDEQVARDLVKGCSSPYHAVSRAARRVLGGLVDRLGPSLCAYFLELMMAEHEEILKGNRGISEKDPIISSLDTFLERARDLKRHCPSQVPRLVRLLMGMLEIDFEQIRELSVDCLQAVEAANYGLESFRTAAASRPSTRSGRLAHLRRNRKEARDGWQAAGQGGGRYESRGRGNSRQEDQKGQLLLPGHSLSRGLRERCAGRVLGPPYRRRPGRRRIRSRKFPLRPGDADQGYSGKG